MNTLWLFMRPSGNRIVACRREDILVENLPPGTKIYNLGLAHDDLMAAVILVEGGEPSSVFLQNVKPEIEVPEAIPGRTRE